MRIFIPLRTVIAGVVLHAALHAQPVPAQDPAHLQAGIPDDSGTRPASFVWATQASAEPAPLSESAPYPVSRDSLMPPARTLRLLPESISPMERVFWGENGLFRSIGWAPLTVEGRKNELTLRRTMLTAHQIGGFVTLGLFVPTLLLGRRNLQNWDDASAGIRPLDKSLNRNHRTFAYLTFSSYSATAALALFSPPPLIRRDAEWGTITIHKTLAWIHFTGMMATPFLGYLAAHATTASQAHNYRQTHQIVALTTAVSYAASLLIITF